MIIAFDTAGLAPKYRNSGIYNYTKNILDCFRIIVSDARDTVIRPFVSRGYSDCAVNWTSSTGFEAAYSSLLSVPLAWRLGGVTLTAAWINADLIFSPFHSCINWGYKPSVTTIHDLTPIMSPSFGIFKNAHNKLRLWNASIFSDHVIVDSERSKTDLIDLYGVAPEKVTVVYLGLSREIFNTAEVPTATKAALSAKIGINRPYVLHHGAVQPRKNLERLIDACDLVWGRSRSLDFQLVLAGPFGWKYEGVTSAAGRARDRGEVILAGPLPDEDLATLIKGAELCVIPSLYEGFCLPLIEAMACGTATIASNSSCLPEVSGGVLSYFDPLSIEDMAEKIESGLENNSLRQTLSRKGIRRASEFSWERCARETLNVLCSVSRQSATRCAVS